MEIGNKLKSRRIERKLSAEYVADKIGIDISTYRKYERNEVSPSLEKLEKIATALEVPIFSLFPDSFTQNNENQQGGTAFLAYQSTIQLSEKAMEHCEARIQELKEREQEYKEEIKYLKIEIKKLRS